MTKIISRGDFGSIDDGRIRSLCSALKFTALFIISFFFGSSLKAFDYGDLDSSRFPAEGWVNLTWSDPGNWQTVNVTNSGLIPTNQRIPANDTSVDASTRLEWITNNVLTGSNLKLFFPAGNYYFKTDCRIERSNVWIDGNGQTSTIFNIDAPGSVQVSLRFAGPGPQTPVNVNSGATRNSKTITVANASGFSNGDYVEVFMDNSGLKDNYTAGQICKVVNKAGNVLTLDMSLGFDMTGKSPKVQRRDMIENIRIQDLKFFRVRDNADFSDNIKAGSVVNMAIVDVTSERSANHHFTFGGCRDVVIRNSTFEDAIDQGAGGHGYGVAWQGNSTRGIVANCDFTNLRHDALMQRGGNHMVVAYNVGDHGPQSGTDNRFVTHGRGAHNNLFEGNISDKDIVADNVHGAELYGNTFFRNKGQAVGDENTNQDSMNIVGNEANVNIRNSGAASNYVGANIVNGNFQGGVLNANSDIPESLFLTAMPSYLTQWPLYGPTGGGGGGGTTLIEAESYDSQNGTSNRSNDGGTTVSFDSSGSWVRFDDVNLHGGVTQVKVRVSSNAGTTPGLELRLGSQTGTLLGSVATSTGGWTSYQEFTFNITNTSGVQDLVFVRTGGQSRLNWFEFDYAAGGGGGTTVKVEAENYNSQNSTVLKNNDGGQTIEFQGSGWAKYNGVNLGGGVTTVTFRVASNAGTAPNLELRLGSETGTLLGSIDPSTGGWTNYQEKTMTITQTSGSQDLVIVKNGGNFRVNWFEFTTQ